MPTFFESGQAWLAGKQATHLSVTASYQPIEGGAPFNVQAVPGRSVDLQVDPDSGKQARVRLDDDWVRFHIRPADLAQLGRDPVEGDRLTVGGFLREIRPHNQQPAVGKSDVLGNMLWVQTQKVG